MDPAASQREHSVIKSIITIKEIDAMNWIERKRREKAAAMQAEVTAAECLLAEPLCDYCSLPAEKLIEVDDSDPAVGYYDTLLVCEICVETYGRRRRES